MRPNPWRPTSQQLPEKTFGGWGAKGWVFYSGKLFLPKDTWLKLMGAMQQSFSATSTPSQLRSWTIEP